MRIFYFVCLSWMTFASFANNKEIAITIDDLPFVASKMDTPGNKQRATERFSRLVQFLTDNHIPATGFVIGGAIGKGQWEFLEQFKQAGLTLGNHTYSHFNLNTMNADKYIADVTRADQLLAPIMSEPKYFRYPYLAEGSKDKKAKVLAFLAENHYTIAPVTIDSKDFQFNEQLYKVPYRNRVEYINKLKPRYLDYIWHQTQRAENRANGKPVKQILLLHANLLNSYLLGDIIELYKKNGYQFITLTAALENPAPALIYPSEEKEEKKNDENYFSPFEYHFNSNKSD